VSVAAAGRPAPADAEVDALVAALPKVSLHCHLLGSVLPGTVVELAAKHGVSLGGRTAEDLYDHASYEDLGEFLRVLDVVGSVVRDLDDLHRVTYESLTAGGSAHGVLYREIQLSPPGQPYVPYPRLVEGVLAGARDARTDVGIDARLIIGSNRERSGAEAVALVEQVVAHRVDEVVGIGLDYAEVKGPPGRFVEAFQLAGRHGLQRTAHSESGPPSHVLTLLDELGCSRVDHGYHVVDDPEITERCAQERVPFTCTPVSSDIGRYSGSGDGTHRRDGRRRAVRHDRLRRPADVRHGPDPRLPGAGARARLRPGRALPLHLERGRGLLAGRVRPARPARAVRDGPVPGARPVPSLRSTGAHPMSADFTVPVVDVSSYVLDGPPQERAAAASAFDEAARTVGFVQVVGHGIPTSVTDAFAAALDEFFFLPMEVKKAYRTPPEVNRGYAPPRTESLSLSLGLAPSNRMHDFFEAFNIGSACSDHPELDLPAADYPENVWPGEAAAFQPAVSAYFAEAGRVARVLTTLFADALDLPAGFFGDHTDHSLDVLRMNNYALPPGTVELDGELTGMGAHTDYGIVTVLWADQVPGLQVLGPDRAWHDVMPADDALLVNLGDLMARWTNERWLSTVHRVVPPIVDGTIERRRSAAFFHDGNVDAVIETLPTCIGDGSRYRPITVGEHLSAKLAGSRGGIANRAARREAARVLAASRPAR